MTEQKTAPLILPKPPLYHIIIVGGGAGGLELATTLGNKLGRRKKAAITLVDRSRTHIWKPLLHEIAAGSMDIDRHEVEYMAQGHWHGFQFRYGEMIGIDRANKRVHLAATLDEDGKVITPDRWLPYDALVIAIGSVTNDFGVPGASQYAMSLDTPEQAARFNRKLINACVRRIRRSSRSGHRSSMSPSSAQEPRARSFRRSCTARRAAWSPSASTRSIPTRTSRSASSRLRTALCRRCRRVSRKRPPRF